MKKTLCTLIALCGLCGLCVGFGRGGRVRSFTPIPK